MKTIHTTLISGLSLGLAGLAYAQQVPPQNGPPPQALQACADKAVNAACSFQSPRGQLQGQCVETPRGQTACLPEGRRAGMRRRGEQGQNQPDAQRQNGQARQNRRGGGHTHTVTQSSGQLNLVPADQNPPGQNNVTIDEQGGYRVIQSNGISKHLTGAFPNSGNPNPIQQQNHSFRVPLQPTAAAQVTKLTMGKFGIGVNGVPFDPGAAETYQGSQEWRYEALSGAVPLGIDSNHAHVQPTGSYHYHGLPTGLMQQLGVTANRHSPIIGWAADGFPIYALYGYQDGQNQSSGIGQHTSGYRLKQGQRPGGNQPAGTYDGTFVNDYQFVAGAGSLDECNGRVVKTPDFPQGTYAYFLSDTYPVIPRCFKGTPSADFKHRVPGMR